MRAFADSYVRQNKDGSFTAGIDPYLDGIYRHLRLARRLLADTGSIFLQISEVNVNRLAVLMDEVFGSDNRVAMINYSTGGKIKKMLSSSGDYILWYAKDKDKAAEKYNQLFESRTELEFIKHAGAHAVVVHRRSFEMKLASELNDRDDKSEWRLGIKSGLTSQHIGVNLQSKPWPTTQGNSKFGKLGKGKWSPSRGGQWRVNNPDGLDVLTEMEDRLCCSMRSGIVNVKHIIESGAVATVPDNSYLQWITFHDEDPGKKIGDSWLGGRVANKWFPVQTPSRIIERCILMTTEPGDLVFDPTCGSGATAVAAEKWGRRWITSDAGEWQIALCRERMVTTIFDEFLLRGTEQGRRKDKELDRVHGTDLSRGSPAPRQFESRDPKQGFVYDRRPRVSAGSLARGGPAESIALVDKPVIVSGGQNRRLASAFTVEFLSLYDIQNVAQAVQGTQDDQLLQRSIDSLEGMELGKNILRNIVQLPSKDHNYVNHEGMHGENKVAIWLAGDDMTIGAYHVNAAIKEAAGFGYDQIVIMAFSFADDNLLELAKKGNMKIWMVVAPWGLSISDTDVDKIKSPVLLAEPAVRFNKVSEGRVSMTVEGYTTWDPMRNRPVRFGSGESEVSCILTDTDYDHEYFFARLIQFPNSARKGAKDQQLEAYKKQLADVLDAHMWERISSTTSVSFAIPEQNGVAVRVTTIHGEMMSRVFSREEVIQAISSKPEETST